MMTELYPNITSATPTITGFIQYVNTVTSNIFSIVIVFVVSILALILGVQSGYTFRQVLPFASFLGLLTSIGFLWLGAIPWVVVALLSMIVGVSIWMER